MREMKDSGIEWIGEIPETWHTSKIKHNFNVGSGTTPKSDEPDYWDGDIIWITPADFKTDDIYVKEGHRNLSRLGLESSSLQIVPAGNIIFSKRAPIGQVVINSIDLCTNQGCLTVIAKNDLDVRFFRYVMSIATEEFELAGSGTTFKEISASSFENTILPSTSVEEQKRIANYLDSKCSQIDAIIEKQQTIIEKLKEYKLSLITECVTKGVNPDAEMKDSGNRFAKNMPAHWENRKMITILSMRVIDGPHESPELLDDGIPYISATAIVNGKIDFSLMRGYISEEYCDICDKRYIPQKGDLLVVKLGAGTGQVAMVDTDKRFNIWVPLAAVRCNSDANPKFVYYAFQSDYFLRQMELSWTFGTQQTLGVQTIERLRILLPPRDEQDEIVSYLDKSYEKINRTIESKQKIINKLYEYKKSLIYEVVTGKKEV